MKIFSCMETTQGAIGSPTIQPKDENCTLTLQTYNKKFIKTVGWEIIDIILSQTPNPDLSHGPDTTKTLPIDVSVHTRWMREDIHVSARG